MKNALFLLFVAICSFACNKKMTTETTKSEKAVEEIKEVVEEIEEMTNEEMKMTIENYPETRRDESVVDDYHGISIADPYRWLEDDHSEETKDWVTRQNEVTFGYLHKIPFREKLIDRLTEIWNFPKYSSPFKEGGKYYFFKNDGLQNQSVLYSINALDDENQKTILDPNKLSDDGTTSLGGMSFNSKGNLLGYMISEGGSDWRSARVMDLETGKLLEDNLDWLKFTGMAWSGDGFYYSRYPEVNEDDELKGKNENHKLYYHKLGDPQDKDELIFEDLENPLRNVYASTSDDEKFLILSVVESTSGNALKIAKTGTKDFKTLVDGFDKDYRFIDNDGDLLLFQTNEDAPNNKIIAIDYNNPAKENWKVIVPEAEETMRGASVVGGKMFVSYLKNASSLVKVFDPKGNFIKDLTLPGIGSTYGISGKKDSKEAFYTFTSFTSPSTIYKLNTETLESDVFRKSEIKFDASNYETKQMWFTSKDGTRVPMFVTHKKGLVYDGTNPTLLYGYGGFDIPITPSFSLSRLPLLENDGIYVVANIRGGGEFGSEWHKAGTLERKQNVFDDFIGAAEYLIANNMTSSDKLAIQGGSNGGLLVGACMTQRPDLFKVCFPAVGVLDMLRYHKFTIGWAWASDYGLSEEKEAFDYLIKYSPLHNVKNKSYPATMVTTADHDDRVVPAHSFKYIAELQNKHQGENPVLIRIETSAGHGAGKPTSKQIEETADILSFMFYNMDENMKY